MKNRILLENYYLPGHLRQQIDAFVDHYNHRRYHESLQNLTPADVYFGRGETILRQRERIKRKTIETRRLLRRRSAAKSLEPDEPGPLLARAAICPKIPDDGQSALAKKLLGNVGMFEWKSLSTSLGPNLREVALRVISKKQPMVVLAVRAGTKCRM